MARKVKRPLRPMSTLNTRQQNERRFARRLGFTNEYAYRRWVNKYSSLPESDPRYFRTSLRGHDRESEIKRLKRIIKKTHTPARDTVRKARTIVYSIEKMSAFAFLDRYRQQIQDILEDPATTAYDKRILRNLLKQLNTRSHEMPEALKPGEQGELFR